MWHPSGAPQPQVATCLLLVCPPNGQHMAFSEMMVVLHSGQSLSVVAEAFPRSELLLVNLVSSVVAKAGAGEFLWWLLGSWKWAVWGMRCRWNRGVDCHGWFSQRR